MNAAEITTNLVPKLLGNEHATCDHHHTIGRYCTVVHISNRLDAAPAVWQCTRRALATRATYSSIISPLPDEVHDDHRGALAEEWWW